MWTALARQRAVLIDAPPKRSGIRRLDLYVVLAIALAALYWYATTQRYVVTITDSGRVYNRIDRWTGTVAIWYTGNMDAMPRWVAIHLHPPQPQ